MNYRHTFWIIPVILIIGFGIGSLSYAFLHLSVMQNYDIYNCVFNNARTNGFNQNQIMVEKIQNECLCFHYYNYTDLLDKNCSDFSLQEKK